MPTLQIPKRSQQHLNRSQKPPKPLEDSLQTNKVVSYANINARNNTTIETNADHNTCCIKTCGNPPTQAHPKTNSTL